MAELLTTPRHAAQAQRLRRARDLVVWWESDEGYALASSTGRILRATSALLTVLSHADEPIEAAELAERAGVPQRLVLQLLDVGVLEASDTGASRVLWPAVELATQRRTGLPPLADADLHHAPRALSDVDGERRDLRPLLPPPSTRTFSDVLRSRRSVRAFDRRPVALREVAGLLVEAAGLQQVDPATSSSRRPYPSGGARHPLELYLVAERVAELEPGCFWFDPRGALVTVPASRIFRQQLMSLLAQNAVAPAGVIVITSRFERTLYKYGRLGLSLLYKDTGCLLQTLYLQANATGLAGYAVGGGPESAIAAGLGLDPLEQSFVGAFIFGAHSSEAT